MTKSKSADRNGAVLRVGDVVTVEAIWGARHEGKVEKIDRKGYLFLRGKNVVGYFKPKEVEKRA